MARAAPPPKGRRAVTRPKRVLQAAVIGVLIVVAGIGGALYYRRYGDKTSTDYGTVLSTTKELLPVEVPPRLWPKLTVRRPDVMTMVVYTTKKDDEACLAIISCLPEWSRERGNRAHTLLQSAVQEYFPQFETEAWNDVEVREVPLRSGPARVRLATSYRADDHKEVRIVLLENAQTDRGTAAVYFQTSISSTTDDEVESILKSLR